jgi:hypothetical protein
VDRLRVALHASDPITMAGMASHLRARADIHLLTERQYVEAEVFVVATESMTPEAMTVFQNATHASAPKVVLITDELRQADLIAAIECWRPSESARARPRAAARRRPARDTASARPRAKAEARFPPRRPFPGFTRWSQHLIL